MENIRDQTPIPVKNRLSRREAQPDPEEGSGCLSAASSAPAGAGEHRREPAGRDSRRPFLWSVSFGRTKEMDPPVGAGTHVSKEL